MSSLEIDIIPATPGLFSGLPLRAEDAWELNCLGVSPEEALAGVVSAGEAWAGVANGKIACAWGVIPQPGLLSSRLWLLTTPLVDRHAITFLRYSRHVVQIVLARHGALEGWVLERNVRSVKWLEWLGFRLGEPYVLEPVGKVRRFEKWIGA